MENPTEVTYGEGKTLVKLRLAVPRSVKRLDSDFYDFYSLTFFDFSGQQAKQFFPPNTKIIVQGHLSSFRGNAEVVVDDCAMMADGTWPYTKAPQENPQQSRFTSYQGRQGNDDKTIVKPFVMNSVKNVHSDYTNGMTIEDISKGRNLKEATVLSYLAEAAFHQYQVDLEFLARKCLLGPMGSKMMETDTVFAAIRSIMSEHKIEDLTEVPVGPVLRLIKEIDNGQTFNVQEKVLKSVTYAQMATVAAMMKRGMGRRDWNAFRVVGYTDSKPNKDAPPF